MFFDKWEVYFIWNWLTAKGYSNHPKVFALRKCKTVTNLTECSVLNRSVQSKFWRLTTANRVKRTKKWVIHKKYYVLVKNISTNWQSMDFQLWALGERKGHGMEIHKLKVPRTALVKKVMLKVFWNMKKPIDYDGTTVNSACSFQRLKKIHLIYWMTLWHFVLFLFKRFCVLHETSREELN